MKTTGLQLLIRLGVLLERLCSRATQVQLDSGAIAQTHTAIVSAHERSALRAEKLQLRCAWLRKSYLRLCLNHAYIFACSLV